MSDLSQELEAALQESTKAVAKDRDPVDPLDRTIRDLLHKAVNRLIPLMEQPRRCAEGHWVPGIKQSAFRRQCHNARKALDARIAAQEAADNAALSSKKRKG